jgi:dihydroorotase
LELFEPRRLDPGKRITAEACVHHLWFQQDDYQRLGTRIKWNPAIKTAHDRQRLREAISEHRIDTIATDHAPHLPEEKDNPYMKAPSGGPMIQHSLQIMFELYHQEVLSLELLVEKMCHAPAELFGLSKRGYIRPGYWADLVLIDPQKEQTVGSDNIYYKCGWSPMEGYTFGSTITHTLVNGTIAYNNGTFSKTKHARRLLFDR